MTDVCLLGLPKNIWESIDSYEETRKQAKYHYNSLGKLINLANPQSHLVVIIISKLSVPFLRDSQIKYY